MTEQEAAMAVERAATRPPSRDGIYPRCVRCGGENYTLAVLAYSSGAAVCAAVRGCGLPLPAGYRRYTDVCDREGCTHKPPDHTGRSGGCVECGCGGFVDPAAERRDG